MRLVWLLIVGATACTTQIPSASSDAAVDAAPFVPPGNVTIRVRNDGTRTLYVQASGWSGQAVTSVVKADGSAMGRDTCEICNCEGCPGCAVCGRSIAAVATLVPGASLDFDWDQIDWSVVPNGCRPTLDCEQPMLVPPQTLTALAVYSDSFSTTTMFGPEESFIGPSTTARTDFQHPASDVIVVPIL